MDPDGLARLRIFVRTLGAAAHELQGKLAVTRTLVGEVPAAQLQLDQLADLLDDMGRIGHRAVVVALDLASIVDRVVAEARAQPKWRGVTFGWSRSRAKRMDGDSRLIGRALVALVGNAADACAAVGGGTVTVSIEGTGEFVDVVIRQTAPFPSAAQLRGLLRPDFSSSKRTSKFGTGIPTACAVANAHGGALEADTNAKSFVLRLPISRGAQDDDGTGSRT